MPNDEDHHDRLKAGVASRCGVGVQEVPGGKKQHLQHPIAASGAPRLNIPASDGLSSIVPLATTLPATAQPFPASVASGLPCG